MSRALRWRAFSLSCALWLSMTAAHAEGPAPAAASPAPAAASPAGAPPAPAAAPPGAKLTAGQLAADQKAFIAGPEGATLALVEGAELRLQPGTRLRFGRTFKLPMGSTPDTIIPTRVLMLDSGWMEAKLLAKHFALFVEAPRKLRSILLEGSLTAIASEPRSTSAVGEGTALVALDDAWKWKRLSGGTMQIVSDVRPDGYRRDILTGVETPVATRSLILAGSGAEASSLLAWPALPNAIAYEVQLRGTGGALVRSEHPKEARIQLADLAPGPYQVTVRGVDDSGIYGPASPPISLNVVGLDIPKTASRGPNGSVRLQPNQRVNLIGAEGLQVAYLGMDDFLPAPQSVGLVARRPISLVLRHPASGETARLDLEPLSVHAQISFAHQAQGWPNDGLELAVRLVDDHGDPVSENFPATCKVTVNVEPTEPTWERSGSVLRTRLAHPVSPAPWMVRVDVLDENGASLGRDFAEVGYQPTGPQAQRDSISVTRVR